MNEEEKKILSEDTDTEVDTEGKEEKENEFQTSDSVSNFAVYCGNELLKKKKTPKNNKKYRQNKEIIGTKDFLHYPI